MMPYNTLTPGQQAVLRAFLEPYAPATEFNDATDSLIDTDTIINEIADGASLDLNPTADFMAEEGFSYHFHHADCIQGWILRHRAHIDPEQDIDQL